ncbi:hypothetical protein MASR2M15_25690 [Anaerolineales bacterium]
MASLTFVTKTLVNKDEHDEEDILSWFHISENALKEQAYIADDYEITRCRTALQSLRESVKEAVADERYMGQFSTLDACVGIGQRLLRGDLTTDTVTPIDEETVYYVYSPQYDTFWEMLIEYVYAVSAQEYQDGQFVTAQGRLFLVTGEMERYLQACEEQYAGQSELITEFLNKVVNLKKIPDRVDRVLISLFNHGKDEEKFLPVPEAEERIKFLNWDGEEPDENPIIQIKMIEDSEFTNLDDLPGPDEEI